MALVRAASTAPRQWHRIAAAGVDEQGSLKLGPAARRLIRTCRPFGRAFYKNLYRKVKRPAPYFAYGCAPGRRREGAIKVQLLTTYRLNQFAIGHATEFYDGRNAFSCSSFQRMVQRALSGQGTPGRKVP